MYIAHIGMQASQNMELQRPAKRSKIGPFDPSQYRYCPHCHKLVSPRTYRSHMSLVASVDLDYDDSDRLPGMSVGILGIVLSDLQ